LIQVFNPLKETINQPFNSKDIFKMLIGSGNRLIKSRNR